MPYFLAMNEHTTTLSKHHDVAMWHIQIEVDRPAHEVWAVLADYSRDAEWRGEVTTMVPTPAGPAAVGTRTTETGRMLGSPFETEGVVLEAGDRWFRWRAEGEGSRAEGSRAVEALGPDRCRVVLGYDIRLTGGMRLLNPVFVAAFRRAARRNLRTLKRLVEAAGAGGGASRGLRPVARSG
jgi:hypothetical protein